MNPVPLPLHQPTPHHPAPQDSPEVDAITADALLAGRGDAQAAARFVRATQGELWRVVAALSSRAEADDLTQETYARAFAGLGSFAGRSSARTWLLGIARRVCADEVRKHIRRRQLVLPEAPATGDPALTVTLASALAALDGQRREAFVLTQQVGLSYTEAAAVCGCPVGTIRSRVARARADLIATLG